MKMVHPPAQSERPAPEAPLPPAGTGVNSKISIHSVSLAGLFVLAVLYTLHLGRVIFLPIAVALLFTVLFSPLLRRMKQLHVPEPLGAALLLVLLVASLGYGVSRLSEPAAEWVERAPAALREAEHKLRVLKKPMQEMSKATELFAKATTLDESKKKVQQVEVKSEGWQIKLFSITSEFVIGFATTLVLLFFLLSSGDLFLQKLVKVLPRWQDKKRAVEIVREIEAQLFRYLSTVTLINMGLGIAVGIAMYLLGMPNPILWGAMAALLTYLPYLGHLFGVIVVMLVAALTFDEVGHMFLVGGVYVGLAIIEGSFATPMILGQRLELNPVMLLLGVMLWGWIWGIGGAFLAVPLLVAFKIFCDHVEALSPAGDFMGK